ncbi:MAG: putative bifunctional diguanylate cyclase/phosphodiesterase [Granulosicoccus sp.]
MDVLLLEDDPHFTILVKRALARHTHLNIRLTIVETLSAALHRLENEHIDIVLVDLNLPDAKGTESIERITLAHNRIPAVVLSNNADEKTAIEVIRAGAQDFLVKGPEGLTVLHRTLRYSIERKAAEFKLKQLASYDSLTKLANRQELYYQMEKACAHADQHGDMLGLFLFDLDRFKLINDHHGHHAGDALLKAFADQLEVSVRTGDTASRMGGDEFAVILEGIPNKGTAVAWANKLLENLKTPFCFEGHQFSLSASVGCALYPAHGNNVESLMHSADIAMYKVKASGRQGVAFYDEQMDQTKTRRLEMEAAIRNSLENDEFQPYFQPQICLDTFEVKGFELLCRWIRPDGDIVLPSEFLPIAKSIQLLPELGKRMRRYVMESLKIWQADSAITEKFSVSINLDEQELATEGYAAEFVSDLRNAGIEGSSFRVEFNEKALVERNETVLTNLQTFRAFDIKVDVDGYGAGQASIDYMHQFSIDGLKIDQSLVSGVGENQDSLIILRSMVGLANELGLNVAANGIETSSQLRTLADLGCHAGQGYLISRPMMASEVVAWVTGTAEGMESHLETLTGIYRALKQPDFLNTRANH